MKLPKTWLYTTYRGYVNGPTGHEHQIKLYLRFRVATDGIGGYEYWGERCFDEGKPCVEDWEILHAELISLSEKSSRTIDPGLEIVEELAQQWAEGNKWEDEVAAYYG